MAGQRFSSLAAWIIAAAVSTSVAAFGIYINSAPIITVSCDNCEIHSGNSCVCMTATEDINVWGMIQKHNWTLLAIYLTLFLAGLCAVALIVERFLFLYNAGRQSRQFQSKAGEALLRGQVRRAICLAGDYADSPLACVINASFVKQEDPSELRPSMRYRHLEIVARTIGLKQGLWHLSAIGWSMALLALLALCVGAINSGRMISYAEGSNAAYILLALTDSISVAVYCLLAGVVILVAHTFFTARVERFRLEMDRLSLAFIEGVTSATKSLDDRSDRFAATVRCDGSRITGKIRAPAHSDDWNTIADGGSNSRAHKPRMKA